MKVLRWLLWRTYRQHYRIRYTCPLLMWLSALLTRARGRRVELRRDPDGVGGWYWIAPGGHGVEVRCFFPRWAILAEHNAHEAWQRLTTRLLVPRNTPDSERSDD